MISEGKPEESGTAENKGDASGKTKEALTAILFISPNKWHYQAPAIVINGVEGPSLVYNLFQITY